MVNFILGTICGSALSFLIYSLCIMAKQSDEEIDDFDDAENRK